MNKAAMRDFTTQKQSIIKFLTAHIVVRLSEGTFMAPGFRDMFVARRYGEIIIKCKTAFATLTTVCRKDEIVMTLVWEPEVGRRSYEWPYAKMMPAGRNGANPHALSVFLDELANYRIDAKKDEAEKASAIFIHPISGAVKALPFASGEIMDAARYMK